MSDINVTGAGSGAGFDAIQDAAYSNGGEDQDSTSLTRDEFIDGAVQMGLDERRAQDIWSNNFGDSEAVNQAEFEASSAEDAVSADVPPAVVISPEMIAQIIAALQALEVAAVNPGEQADNGPGDEDQGLVV